MGSRIGGQKAAARRAGLSLEDFLARVACGEKRCYRCQAWRPRDAFGDDASRDDGKDATCRTCRGERSRASYQPRPRPKPGRRFVAGRDGDRVQARGRANHLVRVGLLPDPNDVACVDCGHQVGDGTRHEYDHHLGYAAEHHDHVQAVCTPCHKARERARGITHPPRGARGRFTKGA